jgi:hypothetical protein
MVGRLVMTGRRIWRILSCMSMPYGMQSFMGWMITRIAEREMACKAMKGEDNLISATRPLPVRIGFVSGKQSTDNPLTIVVVLYYRWRHAIAMEYAEIPVH